MRLCRFVFLAAIALPLFTQQADARYQARRNDVPGCKGNRRPVIAGAAHTVRTWFKGGMARLGSRLSSPASARPQPRRATTLTTRPPRTVQARVQLPGAPAPESRQSSPAGGQQYAPLSELRRLAADPAFRPRSAAEYDRVVGGIGYARADVGNPPWLMGFLGRMKQYETLFFE
jgi:hypothetical protein